MIFDWRRDLIINWTDTILSDKNASQFISGVAFHWYRNNIGPATNLDIIHDKFPSKFILNTEACISGRSKVNSSIVSLGDWDMGQRYAVDIITDLQHWTSGWVDWNMAVGLDGGPNWANNWVNAPVVVNGTGREYYKQPMFYVMGHFSKFLIPDSIRVNLKISGNVKGMEVVAFERPDKGNVVVAVNANSYSVELTIVDKDLGEINSVISGRAIQSYIWWN